MKNQRKTFQIAFPAILASLSIVLIYVASVIPSGKWGVVAVAGLLPAAACISAGKRAGLLCWLGSTLLAFILIPDKFCTVLYGILFGLYPIVKGWIELLNQVIPELLLKLAYFNTALTLVLAVFKASVLGSLPAVFSAVWILYVVGNVVFLIYDFGVTKLITIYISRVRRFIR